MPADPVSIAIAAAALVPGLGVWLARAARRRAQARAAYFAALAPLFDGGETRLQPDGFPRMTGHRGGLAFDLQAIPDTLTFRKLPALWVMLSLPHPLPLAATLDMVNRPSGNEPFTRFATLPHSLPRPAFLPDGVAIRSDNAAAVPPAPLLARHAALFGDPYVKEVLISPRGLRIVILGEEADRGRFLIFRDAEMGMTPLPAARVAPLLDRLAALRDDLLDWTKGTA